jgi:hypothetical protein
MLKRLAKEAQRNNAAKRIAKAWNNNPHKLYVGSKDTALNGNVISVETETVRSGDKPVDITASIVRALLESRKEAGIGNNTKFKVWCQVDATFLDDDTYKTRHHKIDSHNSDDIKEFVEEIKNKLNIQSGNPMFLVKLKLQFNYSIIPVGGSARYSKSKDENDLNRKKSLICIKNNDNNCFWYALLCLMNKGNRSLKDNRNVALRLRMAGDLAKKCNLNLGVPVDFLQIPIIEEKLNINIYVLDRHDSPLFGVSAVIWNKLVYKSEDRKTEKYFLEYDRENNHYNAITKVGAYLACAGGFCETCFRCFTKCDGAKKHICDNVKKKRYRTNNRRMKDELAHYLKGTFTRGSKQEIEDIEGRYKKKEQIEEKTDELLHPRIIIYDIESGQGCDEEKEIKNGKETIVRHKHEANHLEVDVLQIDEELTHEYETCLIDTVAFNGYSCIHEFCGWLFSEKNRHSTVIAHNGAGYDHKFILQWCLKNGLRPSSLIRQGNKITYMRFDAYDIRFIDSYNFMAEPLAKLPGIYGFSTLKGYFPHGFNKAENQNYIGNIPNKKYFGHKEMTPESYDKFVEWYSEQTNITDWNFQKELVKYCRADVEVL